MSDSLDDVEASGGEHLEALPLLHRPRKQASTGGGWRTTITMADTIGDPTAEPSPALLPP